MKEEEISQTLGLGSGLSRVDEDAIEQEFAKLDREIHKESDKTKKEDVALPDAPTDRILPEVPTTLEDQKEDKKKVSEQRVNEPIAS